MLTLVDIKLKNPHLNKSQILGIFYLLANENELTINRLIELTGLPKETVKKFLESISSLLESPRSDFLVLNNLGKEFVNNLNYSPFKWCLLNYEDESLEDKLKFVRENLAGVLKPKREFDQFFALVKTSISKALIVKDLGLIEDNTQIALLGDDDLVSLVLSLINPNTLIHVFDIDEDILNAVKKGSDILGLKNIKTFLYDVKNELGEQYKNKYDVVLTDPPYTKSGFYLFLKRAVELSGYDFAKNAPKHIFAYYGASFKTPEKFLKIQEIINSFGLWQKNVICNFATYNGAEEMGSKSSLYILQTTPQTSVDNLLLSKLIYTHQVQKEDKFPYIEHLAFKIYNVPASIINSKKKLQKALGEFCKVHKLNIVNSKIHRFKPFGYSITLILSSSNLSLHTWPQHKAVYLDLVYCAPVFNRNKLIDTLSGLFMTDHIEVSKID